MEVILTFEAVVRNFTTFTSVTSIVELFARPAVSRPCGWKHRDILKDSWLGTL